MNARRQRGLTLIELVVVILVVGVLAAVAVPTYRNYVMRSQRSDAKEALLALAAQQEKFYLQCNWYGETIANAPVCGANQGASQVQGATESENGWYQLAVDADDTDGLEFAITATAVAGENQFQDTECRTFRVTHLGVRSATDADGTDSTAECWR